MSDELDNIQLPVEATESDTSLDNDIRKVLESAVAEQDPKRVKDLTSLFNMHLNKRNMIRMVKLNDLLDDVVDQSLTRFENNPNNFSNKELIDYMNAVQKTADASLNQLKNINEVPAIQVNNTTTEINIGNSHSVKLQELSRDSRKRILDAIDAIITDQPTSPKEEVEVVDNIVDEDNNGDI